MGLVAYGLIRLKKSTGGDDTRRAEKTYVPNPGTDRRGGKKIRYCLCEKDINYIERLGRRKGGGKRLSRAFDEPTACDLFAIKT